MKKLITIIVVLCVSLQWRCSEVSAQDSVITIEYCRRLVNENYPLVKKRSLIAESRAFSVKSVLAGYFPQFSIVGQTSYQSDVTALDLNMPGIYMDLPDKWQFKLIGEASQILYDGGYLRYKKRVAEGSADIEEAELAVSLYKLQQRVDDLFFGILIIDARLRQNDLLIRDLETALSRTIALIDNGVALKSDASVVEVNLLQAKQLKEELIGSRVAYIKMLALFIGRSISEEALFGMPDMPIDLDRDSVARPELRLFDLYSKNIDYQKNLLRVSNLPKIGLFLQGGIGRPALNMLSNEISPFVIGGVRITIPISGFYTYGNEQKRLDINRGKNSTDRESFLLNLEIELSREYAGVDKLKKMVEYDREIIGLRESMAAAFFSQFENGIINVGDYMREINAIDIARQNKLIHEILLLMTQYRIKMLRGRF